jgi:hypothetical protein
MRQIDIKIKIRRIQSEFEEDTEEEDGDLRGRYLRFSFLLNEENFIRGVVGLEFMQTPLSNVSVDVPPLLVHISRVLRSDGESADADDDCIVERTRFSR